MLTDLNLLNVIKEVTTNCSEPTRKTSCSNRSWTWRRAHVHDALGHIFGFLVEAAIKYSNNGAW